MQTRHIAHVSPGRFVTSYIDEVGDTWYEISADRVVQYDDGFHGVVRGNLIVVEEDF